jgi:uncharacterized protein YbjT (DUF2867 family)
MKIVVIGGTGLIGSKVVAQLKDQGHDAIPASPKLGVNTITGEGVAEALAGASVVIDVSNSPDFSYATSLPFFERSTHNLLAAEAAAMIDHHVALSVVGTKTLSQSGDPDTTTAGYFRAKATQEELIQASGIPFTIVHATQFFEFIKAIADTQMQDGVVHVPTVLFQPMAAIDVAKAVARAAVGAPANGMVEVGGPERLPFGDIVRRVLAAENDPRDIVNDPDAGYYGMPVGETTLVPGDGASVGDVRLDDWLRETAAATAGVG